MKILINTPNWKRPELGGVASFYYGMLGYWNEDVKYNVIGRRKGLSGTIWLPLDIFVFIFKIISWRPDVVMVNPSLFKEALTRDFIFLNISKLFKIPVVVLIHGFDLEVAKKIDGSWVSKNLNKASLVMVLANHFREILQGWNVNAPIQLISTKVEDRMLDGFNIKSRDGIIQNILFLSRMVKGKGVYETIDTYYILKKKYPHLKLTMVGDGDELHKLKDYVLKSGIPDIIFTGPLYGEDRLNAFRQADFFFFPTFYGEGMPTVVLEAMAFGMPILTRPVGGLVDFFENGKMGQMIDSNDPFVFANKVEPFLNDLNLSLQVSLYNHQYALEHFMATKVGKKIESLIIKFTK